MGKEMLDIKKTQVKLLDEKYTIWDFKNLPNGIKNRFSRGKITRYEDNNRNYPIYNSKRKKVNRTLMSCGWYQVISQKEKRRVEVQRKYLET